MTAVCTPSASCYNLKFQSLVPPLPSVLHRLSERTRKKPKALTQTYQAGRHTSQRGSKPGRGRQPTTAAVPPSAVGAYCYFCQHCFQRQNFFWRRRYRWRTSHQPHGRSVRCILRFKPLFSKTFTSEHQTGNRHLVLSLRDWSIIYHSVELWSSACCLSQISLCTLPV